MGTEYIVLVESKDVIIITLGRFYYCNMGNLSSDKNNNVIDWNNNYGNVYEFLMIFFLKIEKEKKKIGRC